MSAIAATNNTVSEEISPLLDALNLSDAEEDVSDAEEDVSDAEEDVSDAEEDVSDVKEEPMNVISSKEVVRNARWAISNQKQTIRAILKAIRHDEAKTTRIQCRVLQAQAAHEAARLRLTIGRVTPTKQGREQLALARLRSIQEEYELAQSSILFLRRHLQAAHDRAPVLQLELEAARHAHKETTRRRHQERQQLYREQRLYQKERIALGYLHPATEPSSPLSLCVKLLSGELLMVEVHSADPVELLPRQFAEQHGYHLGVIPQMTFHLSQEESEESDKPFVTGMTHLSGTRRTWKELFPESQPPMLLFLLRESNDYARERKITLIHDILRRRQLAATMEQDDLWSLYQAWNIHCAVHLDANRWQKLSSFVDDHLHHFVPLTEEMIHEKERRARRATRLAEELSIQRRVTQGEREAILRLLEELRPFFPASYRPLYATFIERNGSPTQLLQELIDVCRQRQAPLSTYGMHRILYALLHYLTLSQLAELRIPASSLCDCHDDSCYVCHYEQDHALETSQ